MLRLESNNVKNEFQQAQGDFSTFYTVILSPLNLLEFDHLAPSAAAFEAGVLQHQTIKYSAH